MGRRRGLCLSCSGAQSVPGGWEVMDPTHSSLRLTLQKYPRRLNWKAPLVTLSFFKYSILYLANCSGNCKVNKMFH